ncbi:MFS transporter [Pseudonocardia sp. C8]|uniref:MFS transporter n=1 Tax=Pseudonocardia sp. C8 TaxID=2762759 RepID=UPI001642E70D|nr:MFS transporter [Pseudonocardia sp. C8]MBC3191190.1 MFS transporter [Pseudonocardia sp. C8]
MSPTPAAGPDSGRRWLMLGVTALGFVAFTFNWFVMPGTFGGVAQAFSSGLPELALLLSAFVGGYAVMHIPAGFLAVRFGLRSTMTAGLALEGASTALAALAPDYRTLLVLRLVAGLAASVFAGIGIAAVSAWFREREHALAMGVVSASFSVGVAVGLYLWTPVLDALGWRAGLAAAGGTAFAVAVLVGSVYRAPDGTAELRGTVLTRGSIRAVLGNTALWRFGLAFFVGYGGYFAVAQLVGTFALDADYPASVAALAALMAGVAGLPGSLVAGWLSDRSRRRRAWFTAFLVLQAAGTLLLPLLGPGGLWFAAFLVGFGFNGCFAIWQTIPADVAGVPSEHVGTAVGLLLTVGGVGGFAVPWAVGALTPGHGYPAAWTAVAIGTLACLAAVATPVRRRQVRTPRAAPAVP